MGTPRRERHWMLRGEGVMETHPRFKIDVRVCPSMSFPFAVYRRRRHWLRTAWVQLDTAWVQLDIFDSIEDARKFIEKIKDLPEFIE